MMMTLTTTRKIAVIGHKRHGKDEVANFLSDFLDMTFTSSTDIVAELAVYPAIKTKYGYDTLAECIADKDNHRKEWFELIQEYNKDDKARATKQILKVSDIRVGTRCREELIKEKPLYNLIIWVDASERKGNETSDSISVTKDMADIIIDNNGTLEELYSRVKNLARFLQ